MVVVLVPEAGDTVQVMKAGLLEIAHIFVVNKADREGAMRMKTELQTMLQLRPTPDWDVPVLLTEAHQDRGVDELMAAIDDPSRVQRATHTATGASAKRTASASSSTCSTDELRAAARAANRRTRPRRVLARVRRGEVDPYTATRELLGDREALRRLLGES